MSKNSPGLINTKFHHCLILDLIMIMIILVFMAFSFTKCPQETLIC